MVVTELTSRKILGVNQRTYQCLKTALSLNLRRQLLIAVCDNIVLQNQLATQLEIDLAQAGHSGLGPIDPAEPAGQLSHLLFNPAQPNLVVQVTQWLKQQSSRDPLTTPTLQILGIEQMTRQPLMLQHHFLQSLDDLEILLPHLDAGLLLWVPWPWLRAIQQSAPRFWQQRSGVFEFVGDPTPIVNLAAGRASLISEESGHSVAGLAAADPSPSDLQLYGEPERPLSPNSPSAAQHPIGDETAGLDQLQATLARLNQALGEAPQAEAASEVPAGGIDLAVPDLLSDLPAELQPEAPEMTDALLRRPFEKLAQLKEDKAPPEDIAHAYLALGHFYRERIEAGEAAPAVVAAAIEAYEEALCWLPDLHEAWGNALNDLGTLYWMQSQYYGDRDELLAGLQRSLETYQTGLTKINQKLQSDVASRLYSNMGAVYSTLAAYDNSVENLKQAIRAYRQALPFCSVEVQMEEYAMLQNSLGSVYWKLSHYEQPKSCLHRAIAAYNEALRCRHPEEAPLDYAAVQNNLGIAYWSLSKHERTVFLLKHAIAAYRDALNYRTPSTDPAACASTYNNLGTAYWELANQLDDSADPKNRYRQNAVIAYEAALKAAQHLPPDQPIGLDLPSIHHCLGNVYDQLAQTADGAEAIATQLNQGLQHYLQALAQQTASSVNYEPIFKALVRNVRNHYEKLGLNGQQQALGKLPAHLLPEVLQSL